MPDEKRLSAFLRTKWLGRQAICLARTGSTNDFLKQRIKDVSHGCAVLCGDQINGRGRRGNQWVFKKDEGLALSFLLKRLPVAQVQTLSLACGLSAARALNRLYGEGFLIKWPNDIVYSGKKIVGILCESVLTGSECSAVCGIGVNLLQRQPEFQAAGLPFAASVLSATGKRPVFEELAAEILNEFEAVFEAQAKSGPGCFLQEYRGCCVTLGSTVSVLAGGREVRGRALDILENGRLLIETGDGVAEINAGEVSVRGVMGYV